jgi:hypothetical protein
VQADSPRGWVHAHLGTPRAAQLTQRLNCHCNVMNHRTAFKLCLQLQLRLLRPASTARRRRSGPASAATPAPSRPSSANSRHLERRDSHYLERSDSRHLERRESGYQERCGSPRGFLRGRGVLLSSYVAKLHQLLMGWRERELKLLVGWAGVPSVAGVASVASVAGVAAVVDDLLGS